MHWYQGETGIDRVNSKIWVITMSDIICKERSEKWIMLIVDKRYFRIDQHLGRHFVNYSAGLSSPPPFLYSQTIISGIFPFTEIISFLSRVFSFTLIWILSLFKIRRFLKKWLEDFSLLVKKTTKYSC